ncbi:hypothetical protein [Hyphomicrobium sp. 99]|uniref:hypothetical protein n=1 Tax=Hyphomicrobium sp. 99 TaxID=1163419 RepID=UPI0005F85229|nr:hypothetical protein [Hyphomicrobium sp. 99]
MHTKELGRTLRAIAELAEFERSQELYRFAAYFEQGSNETILARLKRMSPSTVYPLRLKESVEAIELGFRNSGAPKQANMLRAVLKLFVGRPGASVDAFIAEISIAPPQTANLNAKRFKTADLALVKEITNQLASSSLDAEAFEGIMAELRSPKRVGTTTLALIANTYLGNRRIYRERKAALEAIEKHFRVTAAPVVETCNASS